MGLASRSRGEAATFHSHNNNDMNQNKHARQTVSSVGDSLSIIGRICGWLLTSIVLLVSACGGGVSLPPVPGTAAKVVVVGTPDEITAKREATKSGKKRKKDPLLQYTSHVNGVAVAPDAPHPYILNSGQVLVGTKQLGEVQVAMHENANGKVSDVLAATFQSSDLSIVSAVRADPSHPNAALLTTTGKKGNSFITSYDQSGNAISKFMVLLAEPRDDVLVISDPTIHPTLCTIRVDKWGSEFCDLDSGTDFDQGNTGARFDIDNYLQANNQDLHAIVFDDVALSKIDTSTLELKSAIYFEAIDTMVVFSRHGTQKKRVPLEAAGRESSGLQTGYLIERVATQKEFNDYLDFGGVLTSSPLRDTSQTTTVIHDIPAGSPVKGVLSAVVLRDGTRLNVNDPTLLGTVSADMPGVKERVYTMLQAGQLTSDSAFECKVKGEGGDTPTIAFTAFHSEASARLSGNFLWNGGKPDISLDLNPFVNLGGQIAIESKSSASISCSIDLIKIPMSEYVIPLFGRVQVEVPITAKTEFAVKASGTAVLVSPKFHISAQDSVDKPGKLGVSYTTAGGFKSDFDMKTTLSAHRLGVAQGSNVGKDGTKVGMELAAGIDAGLALSAKVKTWLFKAEVKADVLDMFLGFKAGGAYTMDYTKQTSKKVASEGEAGIGAFLTVDPTITVKTSFFNVSFNLFSFEGPTFWIYKFPLVDSTEPDEPLAPSEKDMNLDFLTCVFDQPIPGGLISPYCRPVVFNPVKSLILKAVVSSKAISFLSPQRGRLPGYKYFYVYKDVPTGQTRKLGLPVTVAADGSLAVQKAGVGNILYEYLISDVYTFANIPGEAINNSGPGCYYWLTQSSSAPAFLDAADCNTLSH